MQTIDDTRAYDDDALEAWWSAYKRAADCRRALLLAEARLEACTVVLRG